jgi:hypothetical protein
VCEIGPGNVGQPFASALDGTGGPTYYGPDCAYVISLVAGSLPPGLALTGVCGNVISGTPTQAGVYAFTVQITPQVNSQGVAPGPSGTAPVTITVGTGTSDRMANGTAVYNGHQGKLYVRGYDANVGAQVSVSVTSIGKVLFTSQAVNGPGASGSWQLSAFMGWPCPGRTTCTLTETNSLGSSFTVTLPPVRY